jgi:outer membrane murein-binding lipoprotein Lpp
VILAVVLVAGCSKPNELAPLERETTTIAAAHQLQLDTLVARIHVLQREIRGNRPGWQTMMRTAELANDQLGLPPFTQTQPPGPEWRPSPATLLGIASYVRHQAADLAKRSKRPQLQFLVDDERRRYDQGIAEVDRNLATVERWLGL